MDNVGKERVQLHQDGKVDIRKDVFHGQFEPNWPVSVVIAALSAYKTTEMGVVNVGKGQGIDMWSGLPSVPLTFRMVGILTGKRHFRETLGKSCCMSAHMSE